MDGKQSSHPAQGHRQRLREKFLQYGIDSFTDDEILELLLTFGTPRKDCKQQARQVRKQFGSLAAVLDASSAELNTVDGLGEKNIFALHFVHGVARCYLKQRLEKKEFLNSSRQVADYLVHTLRDRKRELFMAIFLDAGHAIIDSEIIAEGTVNVNTVYPRELVRRAMAHNAAALVIAHNHPSGRLHPSPQDIVLTRTLHLICSFMNLQLLDHLIVGSTTEVYSFADHGQMDEIRAQCEQMLKRPMG